MEFHISRIARDRYQFDQSLFSLNGNVIFANFHAVRIFVLKMNEKKDLVHYPERAIKAGQINALGLIDEILHHVIRLYCREKNPQAMVEALAYVRSVLGDRTVEKALLQFTQDFPPLAVYQKDLTAEEFLRDSTDGIPNQAVALEEMLMLWVSNKNPACASYLELFDDDELEQRSGYLDIIRSLHDYFDTQPTYGPDQQNLVDMLRSPAIAVPHSLEGQLDFIRTRWTILLGKYLFRLLSSLDLIKEENKIGMMGPGPIPIPVYAGTALEGEAERFSPDREWMPRLVLMAKNTYVWLGQLSKKYQRSITHLDQIPDEELDILASWGFNGLWLIGLWERSEASARIKQLCGNAEAISSAYSLAGYSIAADLGGEDAYRSLRDRAAQRGIRLASDMVPNHMGLDSDWVINHPDYFVSLDYSPFPSYSFTGTDLSKDSRVSIRIEDHYFSRSDAAVVFQRTDKYTGSVKYVYHGNDGTSMPWNDTAQLNYLNPDVREAVIQTILEVARRFPIIRFDAAMTLAKRHYQRLWYPEPGSGGDIPSRAGHGMPKDQFDALIPVEFWREVVDRVAQEAPDTLLLAEAFWLMEGYFVRTLGMHRVYNSAFMNMLRNEENAGYRSLMKNTLEFDPEILKRYVNFMNNPDERTAVDQFGKGDKYFGICTLMATLPGLPMFGHGQIEGYSEKYGMEFRRALWDEQIDEHLVERHQRQVFPLLHRRSIFSGVDNFLLYDFFTPSGSVNEDVYAYSNGSGSERALVVYNNRFADARGWIFTSVGFSVKGPGDQRIMVQRNLGEGLNLHSGEDTFVIFRDYTTQLEYIRPSKDIVTQGVYLELGAYQCHVFLDFREVHDDETHSYRTLCESLQGRGVPGIQEALQELLLQSIYTPFSQIHNAGYFKFLMDSVVTETGLSLPDHLLDEAVQKETNLLNGIEYLLSSPLQNRETILQDLRLQLNQALSLPVLTSIYPLPGAKKFQQAAGYLSQGLQEHPDRWPILISWCFLHGLGRAAGEEDYETQTISWLEEWKLGSALSRSFQEINEVLRENTSWQMVSSLRWMIGLQNWFDTLGAQDIATIFETWLKDEDVRRFLGINRYKDVLWFNQERMEEFAWWMTLIATMQACRDHQTSVSHLVETILNTYDIAAKLLAAEKQSSYQLARLLELLNQGKAEQAETLPEKA